MPGFGELNEEEREASRRSLKLMVVLGDCIAIRFERLTQMDERTTDYAAGYVVAQLIDCALANPEWGQKLVDTALVKMEHRAMSHVAYMDFLDIDKVVADDDVLQ